MENKYLVIDQRILPDVYLKVIEVKRLLKAGKVKGISEGVKLVGISRSAYYKYHQYVLEFNADDYSSKKVTLTFVLSHEKGTLSQVLNTLAQHKASIITINQGVPINELANVTITIDISNVGDSLDEIIRAINCISGLSKLEIQAMGF